MKAFCEEMSNVHALFHRTSLLLPHLSRLRTPFQKMQVPCVVEDEMTFNMHVRTKLLAPKTPVTEATFMALLAANGYIIPYDDVESTFTDDELSWDGIVCKPDQRDVTFHLVVWTVEEEMFIEARWITHLEDTSEGATFAEVCECYAFAKTLVHDAHAFFDAL